MWKELPLPQKTVIVKALSKHDRRLSGDQYGRFIHKNCGVSTYINSVKNWTEMQTSSQKKRKMFEDILQTSGQFILIQSRLSLFRTMCDTTRYNIFNLYFSAIKILGKIAAI